ncbi:MAG: conserved hypothetical protein [Methanobrevibacter sp. CfCl-M3]
MKKEFRKKIDFLGKQLTVRKSLRGWSITIVPDQIRIDNFYIPTHLHLKPEGIHIPVKFKEIDEVGLILELHIIRNNGKINVNELKEELI